MILALARKSLLNRKLVSSLSMLSIGLSVALYLGVDKIRESARESFSSMVSKTDLIVGARGSPIQLLLYSVFHIGNATNNISYKTYEKLIRSPSVAWSIPISLGDSHKGYRVVSTTNSFFENFHFHKDKRVKFAQGESFRDLFDVVLGSEVARTLHYQLGDLLVLSHGISAGQSIFQHGDKPFKVSGILQTTATPIDRSLYITLEGMEAIHIDWQDGVPPLPGAETSADKLRHQKIKITQITAFLLGLKSRIDTLRLQRDIDDFEGEPMSAIIPAVALGELWQGLSYAEVGLKVISLFVILVGFLAMLISIYTSLNERRREIAILRAVGAKPQHIMALLIIESQLLSLGGIVLGVTLLYLGLAALKPWIATEFGLYLEIHSLSLENWFYLAIMIGAGSLLGVIPGIKAYKNSLSDGLAARI